MLCTPSFWTLLLTVVSFLLSGRKTCPMHFFWVHTRRTGFLLRQQDPVLHTRDAPWKFSPQQHLLLHSEMSFSWLYLCTINGAYSASNKAASGASFHTPPTKQPAGKPLPRSEAELQETQPCCFRDLCSTLRDQKPIRSDHALLWYKRAPCRLPSAPGIPLAILGHFFPSSKIQTDFKVNCR